MTQILPAENAVAALSASADELLEKPEVARRAKVSTRTIDQWMRAKRLPFLRIGRTVRFRWPQVLAYLEAHNRVN